MSEDQEQEKAYEVKDKRRVNADGTLKEADEEPEQTADAQEQEPEEPEEAPEHGHEEHPREEMPPPSVYDLLQFVAGMVAEQAWLHMGLRLPPGKKEPVKDLAQAKIAVDTVVFITDKLGTHISEDDRRALRGLVSDLQVNFVKQSQ